MREIYINVLRGLGGRLSLFATSDYQRVKTLGFEADAKCLRTDFTQVGNGLRKVIKQYEQQTHYG